MSAFVREAIRDHLEADRRQGQLDRLEERVAATMGRTAKDVRVVRNDLHVVMAMVDCLVRTYLVHTPPVPSDALRAAAVAGDIRYEKFQKQLAAALQGGTGFFDDLAQLTGDADDQAE